MAILRPRMLIPGGRRTTALLQVPGTGRGGNADGTITWYFQVPVQCKTPNFSWTLSPFKAALLWDITSQGPTGSTSLDILNHAYMIFCRDNMDGIYAVRQEDWPSVSPSGDICPIAWVDAHYDLSPRLFGPQAIAGLFAWSTGSIPAVAGAYGTYGTGALTYPPTPDGTPGARGPAGSFEAITQHRVAAWGTGAMLILTNGRLVYLSNPGDTSTAVEVAWPALLAPDVLPRCKAINGNRTTGEWWALVEYDAGAMTTSGLVVFRSTTQAAVNDTDWTLSYVVEDMTIFDPNFFQGVGIGPNGEIMAGHFIGSTVHWFYWYIASDLSLQKVATPGWAMRAGTEYVAGIFGSGNPAPWVAPFRTAPIVPSGVAFGSMVDATGSIDANAIFLACYDSVGGIYYAVWIDGSLRSRHGPVGTAWVTLNATFISTTPFVPMYLALQSNGTLACIYGTGNMVYLAIYTIGTGSTTTNTGVAAPTYETSAGYSTFDSQTYGYAAPLTDVIS